MTDPAAAANIRRQSILAQVRKTDPAFGKIPIRSIRRATLYELYRLYDSEAFGGELSRAYPNMKVTLSSKMLRSAGKFIHPRVRTFPLTGEIRMSSDFLFRLENGPFHLNGLTVDTPQEAFLVVFEHELIHALQVARTGETDHGQLFQALAYTYFGHTKATHELPTRAQEAATQGLGVGSWVQFSYEGQTLTGLVNYAGKTLTVMVPSPRGTYRDAQGRRYAKFRVSPQFCTPVSRP